MSSLTIELPDNLSQQLEAMGLSEQQLNKMVTYLLQAYLAVPQEGKFILAQDDTTKEKMQRKAGSAKHLNIKMSDDFDEPLEDCMNTLCPYDSTDKTTN